MWIDGLEEVDNRILNAIEKNARLSYSEIAEQVGISRVAVKNHMDMLEEKGIIQEYRTIINPEGDPQGVKFFLDIEAEPDHYHDVVSFLSLWKYNRQIYGVTGESRIHVIGFAPTVAALNGYVERMSSLMKEKGINRIIMHHLTATYKDKDRGIDYVRPDFTEIPEDMLEDKK